MRPRLIIALLFIVALPIATLTWWGMKMARSEHDALAHQLQTLIDVQLQDVQDTISLYFVSLQRKLSDDARGLNLDTAALRDNLHQHPWARQIFVMGGDGERIHPPVNGPLTSAEQRFLLRTAEIWSQRDILYQRLDTEGESANVNKQRVSSAQVIDYLQSATTRSSQSPANTTSSNDTGWYTWYSQASMNLIFWWRDEQNRLIGFELDPARAASDIITALPATGSEEDRLGNAMMRVVNERDAIVYAWGGYQRGEGEKPLALLPLKHPLGSWKLEYYGSQTTVGESLQWLNLLASLVAVAALLGALAWYLYREHSRDMRLAAQRVNFVNQVSHELKTPLTNIRMYAEMLDERVDSMSDDEPRLRRYTDVITSESQRLSRLIANVLSFSQSQQSKLKFSPRTTTCDDIIEKTLTSFRPSLEAKGVDIRFQRGAPSPAQIDPDILEQILNNLFSNVEKYGAGGGLLEITSQQRGDEIDVIVQDHGPGIPKREQERIFDAFYRISSNLTEGVSGAGIGLSIARQLAVLHGGDLTLAARDSGARFRLTLNAKQVVTAGQNDREKRKPE